MTYYFTNKNSNEKIASCIATSKIMAAKFFAELKKLSYEDFIKIFEIKKAE